MLISLTGWQDGRPAAEYLSVTDQASVLDRFLRLMHAVGLELREWGWTEFTILSGSIGPLLMLVGWSWLTQALAIAVARKSSPLEKSVCCHLSW